MGQQSGGWQQDDPQERPKRPEGCLALAEFAVGCASACATGVGSGRAAASPCAPAETQRDDPTPAYTASGT